MNIAQSFIIYAVITSYAVKIFGAFADPILVHIVTPQGVVFVIVIIFLIALLLFNGHKVQQ